MRIGNFEWRSLTNKVSVVCLGAFNASLDAPTGYTHRPASDWTMTEGADS